MTTNVRDADTQRTPIGKDNWTQVPKGGPEWAGQPLKSEVPELDLDTMAPALDAAMTAPERMGLEVEEAAQAAQSNDHRRHMTIEL